jgi:antirestriction protein ArdC
MLIYNATNKHVYSPANSQVMADAMAAKGWSSGEFAGFHQWKDAGRVVRKGETGVPVVMFVDKALTKDGQQEKIKVRKTKHVFNIAQTEPIDTK